MQAVIDSRVCSEENELFEHRHSTAARCTTIIGELCIERFGENHLGAPMSDALGEPLTWECLLSCLRKLGYFRCSLHFMAH
jgi:hypothetical protein